MIWQIQQLMRNEYICCRGGEGEKEDIQNALDQINSQIISWLRMRFLKGKVNITGKWAYQETEQVSPMSYMLGIISITPSVYVPWHGSNMELTTGHEVKCEAQSRPLGMELSSRHGANHEAQSWLWDTELTAGHGANHELTTGHGPKHEARSWHGDNVQQAPFHQGGWVCTGLPGNQPLVQAAGRRWPALLIPCHSPGAILMLLHLSSCQRFPRLRSRQRPVGPAARLGPD